MRVDQRDDQAERLGQVGRREEALGLARVVLVPALAPTRPPCRRRSSAGSVFSPASGGSQPAKPKSRSRRSASAGRPVAVPGERHRQMPLALVGDRRSPPRADASRASESRRAAPARCPPFGPSRSAPRTNDRASVPRGASPLAARPGDLAARRHEVLRVGIQVALGQGQRHAVARGVRARQEARTARGAHAVADAGAGEATPRSVAARRRRHQRVEPPRLVRPVHRRALLVGDQQQQVGRTRGSGHRGRTLRQCVAKPSSDSLPFWPSSVLSS